MYAHQSYSSNACRVKPLSRSVNFKMSLCYLQFSQKTNKKIDFTTMVPHSMTMGNLNKSKKTTLTTTIALKVAPYMNIFHKN